MKRCVQTTIREYVLTGESNNPVQDLSGRRHSKKSLIKPERKYLFFDDSFSMITMSGI